MNTNDIKVILFTDFTSVSANAIDYTIKMFNAHPEINVSYVLAHTHTNHLSHPEPTHAAVVTEDNMISVAKSKLNKSAERLSQFIKLKTTFLTGNINEAVDNITKEFKPDLIVMGKHDKSNVDRMLIGSSIMTVADQANVPVLAIPQGASFKPTESLIYIAETALYQNNHKSLGLIRQLLSEPGSKLIVLEEENGKNLVKPELNRQDSPYRKELGQIATRIEYIEETSLKEYKKYIDAYEPEILATSLEERNFIEQILHNGSTEKLAYAMENKPVLILSK